MNRYIIKLFRAYNAYRIYDTWQCAYLPRFYQSSSRAMRAEADLNDKEDA